MEQATEDTNYQLTAKDRCDACQSQAYVHVAFEFGDLLFCFHHWQQHQVKLMTIATNVVDEASKLLAR
jgi:hypothetical protein